jgi:hypothetical protein
MAPCDLMTLRDKGPLGEEDPGAGGKHGFLNDLVLKMAPCPWRGICGFGDETLKMILGAFHDQGDNVKN